MKKYLSNLKSDFPSGVVVFLVALPLCLGVAFACNAPLISGIIAGIIGGIVVGKLSGSQLSVSGPAAGLITIVIAAIEDLGSFEAFLVAVFLAGLIQIILGFLKGGVIAHFFPNAVIKGMLASIGLILILKQIPHAVGYDSDYEGDNRFFQEDGHNTFSEIFYALEAVNFGAIIICSISLAILIFWERGFMKKFSFTKIVPAPLIVVVTGILLNEYFSISHENLALSAEHLVKIPAIENIGDLYIAPDLSALGKMATYIISLQIAVVASLETLLSLEATDKLDPEKRIAPPNQELKAQGIGNMISGLVGGLPITAVIVRSSANVASGAKSKASAVIHGFLLLLAVVFLASVLNKIPLSALAAILIMIGFKLAKPSLIKSVYVKGRSQFIPFAATILAILFTDLLIGIGIGLAIGLIYVLLYNYHESISVKKEDGRYIVKFLKDVSFLNKASLRRILSSIPHGSTVVIDTTACTFVDADIEEIIEDYVNVSKNHDIDVELRTNDNLKSSNHNVNVNGVIGNH